MTTLDSNPAHAVPDALKRTIAELLRTRLADIGVETIEIVPELDDEDKPAIKVRVKHRLVPQPIEFKEMFSTESEARDLAWAMGERRFLVFDHYFDENQQVARSKPRRRAAPVR